MTEPHDPADVERRNRAFWDADADDYQTANGEQLACAPEAWGVWRIPEPELEALGDVDGRAVLELGCGAAQWSISIAGRGARAVGLDQSAAQLSHARRLADTAGVDMGLVLASATATPFPDESFDVVFCDHGAMSFCDPLLSLPEVARILRPEGILVFCASTPVVYWTWDQRRERQSRRLRHGAFHEGAWDLGDGTVDYAPMHGEWIRLFRANGLAVEDLVELRAPKGATTSYSGFVPYRWARRWPAEQIWKVRKESGRTPSTT